MDGAANPHDILKVLGEKVPGVEFMQSEVFSGDHGLAVIEHAPFGVDTPADLERARADLAPR